MERDYINEIINEQEAEYGDDDKEYIDPLANILNEQEGE